MVGSTDRASDVALRAYCERMWPRLVGGLVLHCGDRVVAEELAQEALVRLWPRWDQVTAKGSPDAWLWTVALNLSRSKRRRRAVERRAQIRVGSASTTHSDPATAGAVAVHDAVAALPDRQRVRVDNRRAVRSTLTS